MKLNPISFLLVFIVFNSALAQIKTDSLVLYYPLSGNANDLSGNQFNGLVIGASTALDRFNNFSNAYDFDGVNDYIEIPTNAALQPNFPFSISLWVKIDQLNTGYTTLYSSCETPLVYSGFNVKCSPTGKVSAQYGNAGGTTASHRKGRITNSNLSIGQWHHVVVSFASPSQIRIFIDGVDDSDLYSGNANTLVYTSHPGALGKNMTPSGTNYHNGCIDDVRLYNDTLSLVNAQFLYYESPCVTQITVNDTIPITTTVEVNDTLTINDTVTVTSFVSSSDTLFIDLPQNTVPIKLYASTTNTELIIDIGPNVSSMVGYSMSINNPIGQQVFFTPVLNPLYTKNLFSFGQLGVFQFYITNNLGQQVVNRKLKLH